MHSLTQTTNTLSIVDDTVVVVDALNYLSVFTPIDESRFKNATAPHLFAEMERRVAEIKEAAATSNMRLIWVFDNGQASEEAKDKWLERRFHEVVEAERHMPCSAETAFYATLEEAGFLVLYPPYIDGDDAVALLAWELDGKVLSRDRDMLRYEPELPHRSVFKGFGIDSNGKLVLDRQTASLPSGIERRDLKMLKLEVDFPKNTSPSALKLAWGMNTPSLCRRAHEGHSKRGNADACTAECGNANFDALALVASVYNAIDLPVKGVAVSLPMATRDEAGHLVGAEMVSTFVEPDACVAKRLVASDPHLAKQWLAETVRWPMEPLPDCDDVVNLSAMRARAGRAHALCMLAAEIADGMRHALGDPSLTSSARRIYEFYTELSTNDPELRPSASEWMGGDSGTVLTMLRPVVDAEEAWCTVVRCGGLDWHGRRSCKAVDGGFCFASSIRFAALNRKAPLCSECVAYLGAKCKGWR